MTEFDATSTASQVVAGLDLSGREVIITGGASGIGLETARALTAAGARVTLAVRNVDAGQEAATTIGGRVDVRALDLSDLQSIDAFVARWDRSLDVLINNAGVMNAPESYTAAGWESHFATNHLGHFALTLGLHPWLAQDGGGRVVVVSSSGHGSAPVDFDDLFFSRRPYQADLAYGQSKTANVLFAVEASRRWAKDGITANALMPGGVWTNLQRHWDPDELEQVKASADKAGLTKTAEQGAATSVLLATAVELDGVGGRYYEDCHEARVVDSITDGLHGVRGYALDPDAARQLWEVSAGLLDAARRTLGTSLSLVVQRLIDAIEQGRTDDLRALLAPDAVFDNGPAGTVRGADQIVSVLEASREGMDRVEWRVQRSAASDGTVFTERLDRFGRGDQWAEIPVAGIFEVDGDRVTYWRDYYDGTYGAAQLEALPPPGSAS